MSELIVNNALHVTTDYGIRKIELCIGSITKSKEPTDVLVVSAFPGDYTPTRTSVIGALKYDLNVSMRKLAEDKEEDLRKYSSCWWSKPLRKNLPFRRILCFEGGFKSDSRPPSTVGEVFRCLVSLCKNKETTVMMSLLSTGNQQYSAEMMLQLIVEAAVHWIKTGLTLKTLKIVVYQKDTRKITTQTERLVRHFQDFKDNWMEMEQGGKLKQDPNFIYDFYLSYSPKDEKTAEMVCELLKEENPDCLIHSEQQFVDVEKSWQSQMYEVMITCRKIVVLLSPDYLETISCVEQYNIALCSSRSMGHDYLAPFYIKDILQMPTYMALIQYLDCRPVTRENLKKACRELTPSTKSDLHSNLPVNSISLGMEYDLFVSYSHRDTDVANTICSYIRKRKPHWKIFIDQQSLSAGSAWQTKLYSSIEKSRNILALMSFTYLESKVCQEEFNLACALAEDPAYSTMLVKVSLDDVLEWPTWASVSKIVEFTPQNRGNIGLSLIFRHLDTDREFKYGMTLNVVNELSIHETTQAWRKKFAEEKFPIVAGEDYSSIEAFKSYKHRREESDQLYDAIISFHEKQREIAEKLVSELKTHIPELSIFLSNNPMQSQLHSLDQAKLVIPLLSKEYMKTPYLMDEFNTALCRHRFSPEMVIFPLMIGEMNSKPVYPLLSFCVFSTEDSLWKRMPSSESNPVDACVKMAAIVLGNVIVKTPRFSSSFKTLLSIRELKAWNLFDKHNKTGVNAPLLFSTNNSSHQITGKPGNEVAGNGEAGNGGHSINTC